MSQSERLLLFHVTCHHSLSLIRCVGVHVFYSFNYIRVITYSSIYFYTRGSRRSAPLPAEAMTWSKAFDFTPLQVISFNCLQGLALHRTVGKLLDVVRVAIEVIVSCRTKAVSLLRMIVDVHHWRHWILAKVLTQLLEEHLAIDEAVHVHHTHLTQQYHHHHHHHHRETNNAQPSMTNVTWLIVVARIVQLLGVHIFVQYHCKATCHALSSWVTAHCSHLPSREGWHTCHHGLERRSLHWKQPRNVKERKIQLV